MDDTKYFHVVATLDSSTTRCVMGLPRDPPAQGKYDALKAHLLQVFQLSDAELNRVGDSKPTELMENMLALLGSGNVSFLFTQCSNTSYRHWCARCLPGRCFCARAMLLKQPLAEESAAAVAAAVPARRKEDLDLCFYHRCFEIKVRRCIPPCSFTYKEHSKASAQ